MILHTSDDYNRVISETVILFGLLPTITKDKIKKTKN